MIYLLIVNQFSRWVIHLIYHGIDNDLVKFALDPIKNRDILGMSSDTLGDRVRSVLNTLIPFRSDIRIFENFLFRNLCLAEKQLYQLKNAPKKECYEADSSKILEEIRKYFRLIVAVDKDNASDESYKSSIYNYIDRQIAITFSYHVDRISERYKIKREILLGIDSSILISSMLLSEIYVFVKSGYINVRKLKEGFKLELAEPAEKFHVAHGLSELLEDKSNFADQGYLDKATSLMNRRYIQLEVASEIIDQAFDKVLSIKPMFLSESAKSSKHFLFIRECIAIMTFTECFKLKGFDIPVSFFIENNLCRSESLNFLISNLSKLNKFEGAHFDALRFDGSSFKAGNLGFELATRHITYMASKLYSQEESLKKELIKFGDIFERDYIYQYLSNLDVKRFKIYPSINPNNNAEIKGYDIDLVIEDQLFEQFYFVQVKYRTKWLPKFYSERCWELTTGILKDYERQLRVFKDNLNHPSIRKKLNQRKFEGLEKATDDNSHFIFLHNLPFLNFYEYNGIHFYEWNLFRNILQGAKVYWMRGQTAGVEKSSPFMLHDTRAAIKAYTSLDKVKTSIETDLDTYLNSIVQLKLKGAFGRNTYFDIPLI